MIERNFLPVSFEPASDDVSLREMQRQTDEWIRTVGVRYFN